MPLPLPQTVPEVGPGGGIPTALSALNALSTQNLQNKILGAQAQYAPYTTYADAASKLAYANMLPYQVQATVMSNPMMWMALKDNPDAIKALMNNFQKSIPQGNNIFGNVNMPAPGQQNTGGGNFLSNFIGDNPLGNLISQITGGGNQSANNALQSSNLPAGAVPSSSNNLMNPITPSAQPAGNTSPIVPATGGSTAGVIGKETAGFTQSPYSAGATIPDPDHPGEVISVPTSRMATQLQTQIAASKRTIPQLEALPELFKPFFGAKGLIDLSKGSIGNFLGAGGFVDPKTLKQWGLPTDSDLPSQYKDAKMAGLTSVESYLKSIGVPVTVDVQKKLNAFIDPGMGENAKSYNARIQRETQRIIKDFVSQSVQQIKSGYSSAPEENMQGGGAMPFSSSESSMPSQSNTGAWPSKKSPLNADQLEGQMPPKGTVWMVRPDGQQVPVHLSNVDVAKQKYNFRGINE